MGIATALLLQTGIAIGSPPATTAQSPDDIVVTGERDRNEQFRLRPLPPRFVGREGLPKAEVDLGGGVRAATELESEAVVGGMVSKRVMARIKLPF